LFNALANSCVKYGMLGTLKDRFDPLITSLKSWFSNV
jgi:hypothetical protein